MARSSARAERRNGAARTARPYGGLPPEERRRDRRERLLDAALHLFGSQGYTKTSIEQLCVRAGVATRHYYDEFESREALLKATYDRIIDGTRDSVLSALSRAGDDPRSRTRASVEAFLRAYLDDPRRGRIACIEIVGVSSALEKHRRSVIHSFARIIAEETEASARAGFFPMRDFTLLSIAMAGAVNELAIESLMRHEAPSMAEIRDELVAFFVAGMQGGRAGFEYVQGHSNS